MACCLTAPNHDQNICGFWSIRSSGIYLSYTANVQIYKSRNCIWKLNIWNRSHISRVNSEIWRHQYHRRKFYYSLPPSDSIDMGQQWLIPMTPCHYLNHCWLLIGKDLRHSPESNFIASAQATILHNEFENHIFKITATSPMGQWIKIPDSTKPKQYQLIVNQILKKPCQCIRYRKTLH